MDKVRTCPACHKENSAQATICTYCGTPLVSLLPSRTTEPISQQPPPVKHPDHVVQLTKLYANIIVFTIPSQEQPILVKGGGRVVLGRYSPGEVVPAVDLTPYNASLLGVSRQHAVITRPDTTYLIQDLNSTNGTWVNDTKLTPHKTHSLQSGDLIRLGQLILYVYFDTSTPDEETILELVLQKEGTQNTKSQLTVQDLSIHVTPYLDAVARIQKICDELLERPPSVVGIRSIEFEPDSGWINIKLSGTKEAIQLLKKQRPILQVHGSITSGVKPQTGSLSSSATTNGDNSNGSVDNQDSGAKDNSSKFATEFVNDIAPNRTDDVKKEYTTKLIPLITLITSSGLDTVDGR